MRSHKKLTLILATVMIPNLAFGLGPITEKESETVKETPSVKAPSIPAGSSLNLAQAETAFGRSFGAYIDGNSIRFSGNTTEACLKEFEFSSNIASGQVMITFVGKDGACLDYAEAKEASSADNKVIRLSTVSDLKLTATKSFDPLVLVSEDPNLDRSTAYDALKDIAKGDAPIKYTSAEDIEAEKKRIAAEEAAVEIKYALAVVAGCGRNLDELDLRSSTLDDLEKIKDVVLETDSKKDDKWFLAQRKKTDEKIFAACKLQITRGKTDQLADCTERLQLLAARDASYIGKIKGLYVDLIGRLMNSTRLPMDEAYDASMEVLATLRELGLEIDERDEKVLAKEEKQLAQLEDNLHLHFLKRAAAEGSESENFQMMQEKALEHMLAKDEALCLTDAGILNPQMRMNHACAGAATMAAQFQQISQHAVVTQGMLVAKANADLLKAQSAEKLNHCSVAKANNLALTAEQQNECNFLVAQAEMAAKATANAGISTSGFAEPVAGTPATSTATAESGIWTNSGLANSQLVYQTAQQNAQQAPQQHVLEAGPQPSVTVNTMNGGLTRR